jgi:hypothetical protein
MLTPSTLLLHAHKLACNAEQHIDGLFPVGGDQEVSAGCRVGYVAIAYMCAYAV